MLSMMRILLIYLLSAMPFTAIAQTAPQDLPAPQELPGPEGLPFPQIEPINPEIGLPPLTEGDDTGNDSVVIEGESAFEIESGEIEGEEIVPESLEPDYSKLSPKAERAARLDDLFVKLAEREDEEGAKLVAEEIMAIWVDSGSASVNLLLRRATDAGAKRNPKLARKMYNHAVDLSPEFAEAWARSARLALTQKDYNRALNESLKTLALEPRHFYTLWTLGNVFEALDRQDEALEAYREANKLYPELKAVKDRLGTLQSDIDGDVL